MAQGFTQGIPVPLPTSKGGTGTTGTDWTARSLSWSDNTKGLVGTATNNSADAGYVGEYTTSSVSAAAIVTNTFTNITTISLTAGDWDVVGSVKTNPAGGTITSYLSCGISTTSATLPTTTYGAVATLTTAGAIAGVNAPKIRLSLSATTTVYLVSSVAYSTSSLTINGVLSARRAR
jgi:hypothetical protein